MMKKKIVILLLLVLYIFLPKSIFALQSIPIKTTIENIRNPIKSTITYKVISNADNGRDILNEPTEVKVNFEEIEVEENTLTQITEIDFSETIYPHAGTYKYGITQKSSDNSNIVLSTAWYEVYVEVTMEEDGSLTKEVSPIAIDLDHWEKEEIEYTNTTRFTNLTLENRVEGDFKEIDKNTYFKYKVVLFGPVGDVYTIQGQDEIIVYDGEKITPTTEYIVEDNENTNFVYLYLKDGQKVTIGTNEEEFNEIPIGTEYIISKINGEKWETTMDDIEQIIKTGRTTEEENICYIVNTRNYDSAITGLFYRIFPFLIIIGVSLITIIILKKLNWKKK